MASFVTCICQRPETVPNEDQPYQHEPNSDGHLASRSPSSASRVVDSTSARIRDDLDEDLDRLT